MNTIINNPWVVGIGAGVVSSLIVAIVTRAIFSKRDVRERMRRAAQANQEVLYALRPGISEGVVPGNDVLRRIIEATARRYDLESTDLYSLDEIAAELTKEVMDSSFISAATKRDFCEKLSEIGEDKGTEEGAERTETDPRTALKYRRQLVAMMSMMVGILTAIMGFVTTLDSKMFLKPEQMLALLVPGLVAVLVATFTVILRESKLRLRQLDIRFGGLRAELYSGQSGDRESMNGDEKA